MHRLVDEDSRHQPVALVPVEQRRVMLPEQPAASARFRTFAPRGPGSTAKGAAEARIIPELQLSIPTFRFSSATWGAAVRSV